MSETQEKDQTVKRTVVLHPLMDSYVRRTWSMLIEEGFDATYSMALNFMLLTAVMETQRQEGLSKQTLEFVWSFIDDEKTIDQLNLQEHIVRLREHWGRDH